MNGIYTMSCYVNVMCLGKKIAPRCSGKFWKKFFTVYKTGTKMRKNNFINLFGLLGDENNFLS